jgi:hypothetical protein
MNHQQQQKAKEYWAQQKAENAQPQSIVEALDSPVEPEPEQVKAEEEQQKVKQQTRAAQARYAGERASEQELRDFFQELALDKAFKLYHQMRTNLEIAGKILNERSNVPEVQHCKTCGVSFEDYKRSCRKNDWFLNRPFYHEGDRNIIDQDHFCSAACVSLENNKTQGVYGMSDRGMTPYDNPKNHPYLEDNFPEQRKLTDHDRSPLRKKA